MSDLNTLFYPVACTQNDFSERYVEILPCEVLKPFVRCYWGEVKPFRYHGHRSETIIPDTCMDIYLYINYSTNEVTHNFIGIGDTPLRPKTEYRNGLISHFGARLYFWAVHLFIKDSLNGAANSISDLEQYLPDFKRNLENILVYHETIEDRIYFIEQYLLGKLRNRFMENHNLMNAVFYILKTKGVVSIPEVCEYAGISQRHLERIFFEYIGFSPKRVANMVRYQNVWQDISHSGSPNFHDIVHEYGYTDQAHLINDFRKHHGSTPLEAYNKATVKKSDIYNQ